MIYCDVGSILSGSPFGRYYTDGWRSGEAIREEIVAPVIKNSIAGGKRVSFDLSGLACAGSGVMEECFGGLIRYSHVTLDEFRKRVVLTGIDNVDKELIDRYMSEANLMQRSKYVSNLKSAYKQHGIPESRGEANCYDFYERHIHLKSLGEIDPFLKYNGLTELENYKELDFLEIRRVYSKTVDYVEKFLIFFNHGKVMLIESDRFNVLEMKLMTDKTLVVTVSGKDRVRLSVKDVLTDSIWRNLNMRPAL